MRTPHRGMPWASFLVSCTGSTSELPEPKSMSVPIVQAAPEKAEEAAAGDKAKVGDKGADKTADKADKKEKK